MTEPRNHDDFAPYVGWSVRIEGWQGVLTLARIDTHPSTSAGRTPFTLLFRGPIDDILPEGLHRAMIDGGPSLDLYIMPIHTPARDRQDYQSVFN